MVSDVYSRLTVGPNSTRVGVVSYDRRIQSRVEFQLDAYPKMNNIAAALIRNSFFESSVDPIEVMRTRVFTKSGDRFDVHNIAVVIAYSDFDVNTNNVPYATLAKNDDITILAIDKSNQKSQLMNISSTGVHRESYWLMDRDENELIVNELLKTINKLICRMKTYGFRGII